MEESIRNHFTIIKKVSIAHTFGAFQTTPLPLTDLSTIVSLTFDITALLSAILDNPSTAASVQTTISLLALLVTFRRHSAVHQRAVSKARLRAVAAWTFQRVTSSCQTPLEAVWRVAAKGGARLHHAHLVASGVLWIIGAPASKRTLSIQADLRSCAIRDSITRIDPRTLYVDVRSKQWDY